MAKKLRRCVVCGKFHASFLVPDHPGGKGYYCASCWRARFGAAPPPRPEAAPPTAPKEKAPEG